MYKFGKITIICVGDLKDAWLKSAQNDFLKRLLPYGKITICETPEDRSPQKEAAKIHKQLSPNSYKIALDISGTPQSSESFAATLCKLATSGRSHLQFIIGGSAGLSPEILKSCHARLSLSPMTFTHRMARIILLEQIYRCCRILNNEPYHN